MTAPGKLLLNSSFHSGKKQRKLSGDNFHKASKISIAHSQFSNRNLPLPGDWPSAMNLKDKSNIRDPHSSANLLERFGSPDRQIDETVWLASLHKQETAPHLKEFLSKSVNFNGNNLDQQLRKMCLICRAALEKPELLMIFEETLEFGDGIDKNLRTLFRLLEDTTVIVITKTNSHLHLYNKVVLMDAGYLFNGASLEQLLQNEQSFMYKFLHETDQRTLHAHLNYFGIPIKSRTDSNLAKTGGVSILKHDDLSKIGEISFAGKHTTQGVDDHQSHATDSQGMSKVQSNRDLAKKVMGEFRSQNGTGNVESQGGIQVQVPLHRNTSLSPNPPYSATLGTKLGQALREAFKINPIPTEVPSPKIRTDPANVRNTVQSLSVFAPPI